MTCFALPVSTSYTEPLTDPTTDSDRVRNGLASLQALYIILYSLLKVWKRLESPGLTILAAPLPPDFLDNGEGIFVLERQHTTAGVFDHHSCQVAVLR